MRKTNLSHAARAAWSRSRRPLSHPAPGVALILLAGLLVMQLAPGPNRVSAMSASNEPQAVSNSSASLALPGAASPGGAVLGSAAAAPLVFAPPLAPRKTPPGLVPTETPSDTATPSATDTSLPPSSTPVPTGAPPSSTPTGVPPSSTPTGVPPTATATDTSPAPTMTPSPISGAELQPSFPLRAAFYYPWFPQAWTQLGIYPYTNYQPDLDFYDGSNATVIAKHIADMQYGGIKAGILSWWGQGDHTDTRVGQILNTTTAAHSTFRWGIYYEPESQGDPSVSTLHSDLLYLHDHYGSDPSFLRIDGRFVVFVYADAADACGMADRWTQANAGVNAYLVLKVFPGYAQCPSQPAGWHQYAPAAAADSQGSLSYTISPGFWKVGEAVRLARDPARWRQNVRDMVASGANFQLITTFNEWGEGTSVEPASQWTSPSGYGVYLEALHDNGAEPPVGTPTKTPPPSSTPTNTPVSTNTPTKTPAAGPTNTTTPATLNFAPVADSYVNGGSATTNYGTSSSLRTDGSPIVRSYLRFDVQGLGGQVTSATLRVYANSNLGAGYDVYQATGSWTETGVNYNNMPALGSRLGSTGPVNARSWTEIDVSSAVVGNGTFDFALASTSATALSLGSREGAQPPQLIVQAGSQPPAATSTPTKTPVPTNTPTKTPVPSSAPTNTPVPSSTPTKTPVPTNTPTKTPAAGPTNTTTPATLNFAPVADAYVDAGSPTTNRGTLTALRTDGSPIVRSYLRFDVQGLGGQVTSATLRVYANSNLGAGYDVYQATGSWTETGVNYNNMPALGSRLGSTGPVNARSWTEIDVSSAVVGNGTFDFALASTSATALSLSSREGAQPPELIVQTGSQPPAATSTPTRTPTATATRTSTPPPGSTPTRTPTATPTATRTVTPSPTAPGAPTATPSACSTTTLTKGPTLILTGNNTQMKVFWQWSATASFTLRWGTDTRYSAGSASVSQYDSTNHLYAYTINGLTPGAKYEYQVQVGSQCAASSFYAPPASSATNVKFFSYGDTRTNGSAHNGLAGQIVSLFQSDPAFQTLNLNVGDWVSGDSESAWTGEWFNTGYTNIRKEDASIADNGVRGNHEGSATYWKRYFPQVFQPGGLYWSFDYGPMHIAMLDQYTSYSPGSTQYNWLQNDLAASTKTWKFVVLHEPGWSAGGGHGNNTAVQNNLEPLFRQYGVSIVFGGHNHYYARAVVDGIQHLTVGGGGAPSYTPDSSYPNIVVIDSGYSFGEFTIAGNKLDAKIVDNSGKTVDSFSLTR